MTDCPSCQAHTKSPLSGAYNFYCIQCMARLITDSRPDRAMQERQIAALAHFHRRSGTWPELFEKVKTELKRLKNEQTIP